MSCPICHLRRERRFCPAVHGQVCAQCCGEQREVTLDCPSDCPYLQQAREHERHRNAGDLDPAELFPKIEIDEPFLYEREHLLLGLSFALAKSVRANRSLTDRDLIAALTSFAQEYETMVNSSLIYEQRTPNLEHQAIVRQLEEMVKGFREAEQKHLAPNRLRGSEVLKALVFLLRLGLARTSGRPKSRAFIDFILAQLPESPAAVAAPDDASNRIIVP